MRLPRLNALRAFEAAARHCSFKRAGEEIHVAPGAISRFVKLLEDDLNVVLFERLPNGLRLTETGKALYPKLTRAFGDIETAIAQSTSSRNQMKVVLPATIGSRLLIKKISEFNAAKLGAKVHCSVEFRDWDDYFNGGFDMGVCCYVGLDHRPNGLEFRFLRSEALTPLCSPSLVGGDPPLRVPEDLSSFELLHPYLDKSDWRKWLAAAQVDTVDPESGQTFMTMEMAVKAATEGHGITIGDVTLFEDEVQKGELVAPFEFVLTEHTGYFIFGRPSQLSEPHVKTFCEWLTQQVGQCIEERSSFGVI